MNNQSKSPGIFIVYEFQKYTSKATEWSLLERQEEKLKGKEEKQKARKLVNRFEWDT